MTGKALSNERHVSSVLSKTLLIQLQFEKTLQDIKLHSSHLKDGAKDIHAGGWMCRRNKDNPSGMQSW